MSRVRADNFTNSNATGAPSFPFGANVVGVITATSFSGDGSQLSGVVSGVEVLQAGSSVGTSITAINFAAGATLTGGSGFSTVTIASAGISTAKSIGLSFYLGY